MSFLLSQGDFFGRLSEVTEQFPIWLLFFGAFVLLTALQVAFSNRAFCLIPIYFGLCMFSGNTIEQLDSGTTMLRWWLIFCLAAASIKKWKFPGTGNALVGLYSIFLLISVIWSPNPLYGLQLGILGTLMFLFASGTISSLLFDVAQIRKCLTWFLAIAPIFIFMGIANLGDISGSRFGGAMGRAVVLFVITSGTLMPLFLWGTQSFRGFGRTLCYLGFCLVLALGLLSGQRSGFFAGSIASIPFIIQLRGKFLAYGLVALTLASVTLFYTSSFFPDQFQFIYERFFVEDKSGEVSISTDFSGREELWEKAFAAALKKPVTGHGAGADKISEIGLFHNAYLQEWYNGGLIGLLLFAGASFVTLFQTFALLNNKCLSAENIQIVRLLFCWILFLVLVSLVEAKLQNPSNIMAFVFVFVSVSAYRLRQVANHAVARF